LNTLHNSLSFVEGIVAGAMAPVISSGTKALATATICPDTLSVKQGALEILIAQARNAS